MAKSGAQLEREIAQFLYPDTLPVRARAGGRVERTGEKTPALDDMGAWLAASASSRWFRVTTNKGNAKGHVGTEGRLAWLDTEGSPRALPSSPDRLKVSRIGLNVEGRKGYLFLNPRHVALIPGPTSPEDRIAIEVMSHGVSKAFK